jgi:hypothetical protein
MFSWRESNCFAETRQLQHARCVLQILRTANRGGHPIIDPSSTMCPISVWFSFHVSTNSCQYNFFLSRFVIQDFKTLLPSCRNYRNRYVQPVSVFCCQCWCNRLHFVPIYARKTAISFVIPVRPLGSEGTPSDRFLWNFVLALFALFTAACAHSLPLTALRHYSRHFIGRPADVL